VVLYVNDMLLVGNNINVIKEVKSHVSSKFDMKGLSAPKFIPRMRLKLIMQKRNCS
jgi:hypothetical protein